MSETGNGFPRQVSSLIGWQCRCKHQRQGCHQPLSAGRPYGLLFVSFRILADYRLQNAACTVRRNKPHTVTCLVIQGDVAAAIMRQEHIALLRTVDYERGLFQKCRTYTTTHIGRRGVCILDSQTAHLDCWQVNNALHQCVGICPIESDIRIECCVAQLCCAVYRLPFLLFFNQCTKAWFDKSTP